MNSSITARDWKAIAAYVKSHQLRPQLSAVGAGQFTFLDLGNNEVTVSMLTMKKEYDDMKALEKQRKKEGKTNE